MIKLLVFYSSPDDLPRSGQVDCEAPVGLQTVSLFTFWGEVEENAPLLPHFPSSEVSQSRALASLRLPSAHQKAVR